MKKWDASGALARDAAPRPANINPEAYLDPYALLEAVRTDAEIVDFVCREANRAAWEELSVPDETLVGVRLLDLAPTAKEAGLFAMLTRVVESGQPLTLEDWEYPAHLNNGQVRYFDMSAVRVGDGIGLAWWDVTQRYAQDRDVAKAEREISATLESLLDPHVTFRAVRDEGGAIVDLEYTRINAAACAYLQTTREHALGRRLRDLWTAEAVEVVDGWGKQVLETGEPLSVDEFRVPLPGAGERRLDVRAVRVDDTVSFTWRDVTSRVRGTQQIAQSRERYRLLAENASEVVIQAGPDGQISWMSPSVRRVLGLPPEHFLGSAMSDFVHPDDVVLLEQSQRNLMARKELTEQLELRLATSQGTWRWMSVLRKALTDDRGELIGGVCAMRDIQERKNAQFALEESEERFRRSMMDAAIGMAIVAPTGGLLRVNRALCELLGRDETTLMSCAWQELTHPDDLELDQSRVAEVMRRERDTYRMAKRYLKPGGQVVWADLTASAVRDEHGDVRYFVSQIIDITDSVDAREALASSEEHYRLMAENSSDVVFRSTVNGCLEWVSPSAREVLGWSPTELIGDSMMKYLKPGDLPESLKLGPDNRDRIDFEGRCCRADGGYLWMDISSRPLIDESGQVVGRMGRLRDIQAEHQAREALRHSEQRFRTAMESAPTGMAVVGLNRDFVQVNPALCELLGRTEQWLLEHGVGDVLDPPDDDLDRRLRAQILAGLKSSLTRDHQMVRSDGQRLLVEQSIGLLRNESGQATGYVSQFADVTEAREARDQLRFLATHDSMTELLNRRELVNRISGVLSQRPRTGVNTGVLFIDLDGLKPVNDTYGHAVGDAVIVTVAQRIRQRIRANDLLARFGGDEFVLVLPAIHSVVDTERIATSLHEAVGAPMDIEGNRITMTLSVGIALVSSGDTSDVALRRADAALYRAKRQGKACTAVYDPDLDG